MCFVLVALFVVGLAVGQHDHPADRENLLEEDGVSLSVELDVSAPEATGEPVVNPEGTFRAYVSRFADVGSEQLYVEDLEEGTIYHVRGLPFPARPISSITWYKGGVLAFDRSVNPRTLMHFVVDMKSRKVVEAATIRL